MTLQNEKYNKGIEYAGSLSLLDRYAYATDFVYAIHDQTVYPLQEKYKLTRTGTFGAEYKAALKIQRRVLTIYGYIGEGVDNDDNGDNGESI